MFLAEREVLYDIYEATKQRGIGTYGRWYKNEALMIFVDVGDLRHSGHSQQQRRSGVLMT